jgi:hypothetical protein
MDSNETTSTQSSPDAYNWKVGELVRHNHIEGLINFISEEYITVCIAESDWKTCVLVYPAQYKDVVRNNH